MPVCLRCGTELKPDYKFCLTCGYPVQHANGNAYPGNASRVNTANTQTRYANMPVCAQCGAAMKLDYKFCMSCGSPSQKYNQASVKSYGAKKVNSSRQKNAGKAGYPVCKNCGERVEITDEFCMSCGFPTQFNKQPGTDGSEYEKEQCFIELKQTCEYFERAQSLYDAYDECFRNCLRLRELLAPKKEDEFSLDAAAITMIIVGAIALSFGFIFFIGSWKVAIWILIAGGILLTVGILLLRYYINHQRALKKELDKYCQQQVSIGNELTNYYINYGNCIVKPEYSNPKILKRILQNMNSGKDSLDKAIKALYRAAGRKEFLVINDVRSALADNKSYRINKAADFIPAYFFNL